MDLKFAECLASTPHNKKPGQFRVSVLCRRNIKLADGTPRTIEEVVTLNSLVAVSPGRHLLEVQRFIIEGKEFMTIQRVIELSELSKLQTSKGAA